MLQEPPEDFQTSIIWVAERQEKKKPTANAATQVKSKWSLWIFFLSFVLAGVRNGVNGDRCMRNAAACDRE